MNKVQIAPADIRRASVYYDLLKRMGMRNCYVAIFPNHKLVLDHKGSQHE